MTKRWSSTVSDLSKSKRRASKDARREFTRELLRADKELPEASFNNVDDMLVWLNDELAGV